MWSKKQLYMKVNFNKTPNNLIPAIIQDNETKNVLMLGYMNQEALDQTYRDWETDRKSVV